MRAYLLTLILLLSTFTSRVVAQDNHFIATSSPTLKVLGDPQPTAYEMRCRGSKSSVALIFKTISSRPSPTGETIVTDELAYTPSVRAAGSRSSGLNPGECSWIDRPVNNNEPYRIRFDTSANAQLKQTLHGTPVDRTPTAAERYPDADTIPLYLKSENHYWSFFVYNTRKGYLQATGNNFWKPTVNVEDVIRTPNDSIRNKDRVLTPKKP